MYERIYSQLFCRMDQIKSILGSLFKLFCSVKSLFKLVFLEVWTLYCNFVF